MARGILFWVPGLKNWKHTDSGTAGQVLTSNGADADPTFEDATGGAGAWIPLSAGVEPLAFLSDGAGNPVLVAYTP